MVIDCDHHWTDEDIAYAMALMPLWFKETWDGGVEATEED